VLLILGSLVNREPSLPEGAPQGAGQTATAVPVARTITIPPGTKVTLALTSPIWAKTVKAGDAVYAVTSFPVVIQGTMLIPPGTYVLGQIDSVTKPGWKSPRAQFQMHFIKIIFSNGYTLELADAPAQAATATVHVDVTARNDVLLDNGGQFDMTMQTPLPLGRSGPQVHRQSFQVANEVQVSIEKLSPGSYEVTWLGTATEVQLELLKGGKVIAEAPARIGFPKVPLSRETS